MMGKLTFEMKPEVLFRILLLVSSSILSVAGAVLLFGYLDWFGLAGWHEKHVSVAQKLFSAVSV